METMNYHKSRWVSTKWGWRLANRSGKMPDYVDEETLDWVCKYIEKRLQNSNNNEIGILKSVLRSFRYCNTLSQHKRYEQLRLWAEKSRHLPCDCQYSK